MTFPVRKLEILRAASPLLMSKCICTIIVLRRLYYSNILLSSTIWAWIITLQWNDWNNSKMLFDFLIIIEECLLSPASKAFLLNHLQLTLLLMHYTLNPYGRLRWRVLRGEFRISLRCRREEGGQNKKEGGKLGLVRYKEGTPLGKVQSQAKVGQINKH